MAYRNTLLRQELVQDIFKYKFQELCTILCTFCKTFEKIAGEKLSKCSMSSYLSFREDLLTW